MLLESSLDEFQLWLPSLRVLRTLACTGTSWSTVDVHFVLRRRMNGAARRAVLSLRVSD